jgi:hypothetical protein
MTVKRKRKKFDDTTINQWVDQYLNALAIDPDTSKRQCYLAIEGDRCPLNTYYHHLKKHPKVIEYRKKQAAAALEPPPAAVEPPPPGKYLRQDAALFLLHLSNECTTTSGALLSVIQMY